MSFVLAVEPDGQQAEALRGLVAHRSSDEFVFVASPHGAEVTINRRVPDLVLLSSSLDRRQYAKVVSHFESVSTAAHPPTLKIPPLLAPDEGAAWQDRLFKPSRKTPVATVGEAFLAEIEASLTRCENEQRLRAPREPDPPAPVVSDVEPLPAADEAKPEVAINLNATPAYEEWIDPEVHYAEIALVQELAQLRLTEEVERVKSETATERAAELARIEAEADERRRADVAEARAVAGREARDALIAEIARGRAEAERALAAELARAREEASQHLAAQLQAADTLRARAVEEARTAAAQAAATELQAQVHQLTVDADARLARELQRAREEAERARQAAEEAARESASRREDAARQATTEAEAAAAHALETALARLRAESDARLTAEVARAREEAEQARVGQQRAESNVMALRAEADALRAQAVAEAREAAEREAAAALEAEIARLTAEGNARLDAEVRRAHEEAEQARRALALAAEDKARLRDAAARDAREQAEAATARELAAELARLRAASEAHLAVELTRAREDATRIEQQRTKDGIAAARESAARDARAAAEAAAAQALEEEITRVRAEADARLRSELERVAAEVARVREDAERARSAGASELADARRDAEREARTRAEAVLAAEIARARSEAEARLAAEVARFCADHEAQLNRSSLDHTTAAAGEDAPSHQAIPAPAVADTAHRAWTSTTSAVLFVRTTAAQVSPRVMLAAAAVILVATTAMFVDVRPLKRLAGTASRGASRTAADAFNVASDAARTFRDAVVRSAASAAPRRPPSRGVPATTSGATAAPAASPAIPESVASGVLVLGSRIPMELRLKGRRIGTTDDPELVLAPGRYQLELVNRHFNYQGTMTVDVKPGRLTSLTVPLPNGSLQVHTQDGAEVWIEGERVGTAPMGPTDVQIGTREIVVRHADFGERREAVEIRYGALSEVTINLRDRPLAPGAFPWPESRRIR